MQSLVVLGISEADGLSAKELGKRLLLDNATLSGVLDRLSEGGWITKGQADKDKRFLRLHLSNKSKRLIGNLISERDEANREVLGGLRIEEQMLLKRILRDLK